MPNAKDTIALSTAHFPWPYVRQTPGGDGRFRHWQFTINSKAASPRVLAILDSPHPGLETLVPVERRVLVITEPPEVKTYARRFIDQFGVVIAPFSSPVGVRARIMRQQGALSWHYGVDRSLPLTLDNAMSWQQLERSPAKIKSLSVICSSKTITRHQRQRRAFVIALREKLGDNVDIFGGEWRRLADKAEAIAPYLYHIVLENNAIEHGWTEKLADCFLGEAFAIYSGGRGLENYFDPRSFAYIDITSPAGAVASVESLLHQVPYDAARDAILKSKSDIFERYNIFAVVADLADALSGSADGPLPKPQRIYSNKELRLDKRLLRWTGLKG